MADDTNNTGLENENRDETYAVLRDLRDNNIDINGALDKLIALGAKSNLTDERKMAPDQRTGEPSEAEPRMGVAPTSERVTAGNPGTADETNDQATAAEENTPKTVVTVQETKRTPTKRTTSKKSESTEE